jgi:hypothetical protein
MPYRSRHGVTGVVNESEAIERSEQMGHAELGPATAGIDLPVYGRNKTEFS